MRRARGAAAPVSLLFVLASTAPCLAADPPADPLAAVPPGLSVTAAGDLVPVPPATDLAPLRPFRIFTRQTAPGLPQNTVTSIVEDAEGVLWLGTLDGLASYDGGTVTDVSGLPGTPKLGVINALAVRAAGGVYAGTLTGLYARLSNGSWRFLGQGDAVASVVEETPGIVWSVDQQGHVHRTLDGRTTAWTLIALPAGSGPAVAVARAPDATIWIATRSALLRAGPGGRLAHLADAPPGQILSALLIDRMGHPWIGTSGGTLVQWRTGTGLATEQTGCGAGIAVTALVQDWRNRIWAACGDGRVSVGPPAGPREVWGANEGLRPGERIGALAVDRHGSLWIGRDSAGALQLVSESWRHRAHWTGTERHIPGESVFGLSRLRGGGLLAAVYARGIWRWDGARVSEIGADRGLIENVAYAVEPVPGVLWAGARFGLYESRNGGTFRRALTLPAGFVTRIAQSPRGLWHAATSAAGLWTYQAGQWRPLARVNEHLPHQDVRGFTWLRNGELWLATGRGVAVAREGRAIGIDAPGGPGTALVNCIIETADGDVWVGGQDGLWIRRGTTWHRLRPDDGIPGRTIYSLAVGADGSIWAGGSNGVGRFKGGSWQVYDRTAGLIEDECEMDGLAVMPDGRVLVGTMGSLALFDPSVPTPPRPPLRLFWRETPAAGTDGVARLPKGVRRAMLRWSAPWLSPEPVEYRWRVLPGWPEYSPPALRSEVGPLRLEAGRSTVEVQARLRGARDGGWTPPITLRIDVAPYWHETWWARAGAVLLLLSLVPAGVRLRTRRLERRQRELQRAVDAARADVKTLRGLLPICASCKRIRDDEGSWHQPEVYIKEHSHAMMSHGICPACMARLYPDIEWDPRQD